MRRDSLTIVALFVGATSLAAADCVADSCLRAMRATQTPGRPENAQALCSNFTSSTVVLTAIPTYAAKACKENRNGDMDFRLSSAHSCIAPATTTSLPATSTGACAEVSVSWASQVNAGGGQLPLREIYVRLVLVPSATNAQSATPTVAASLARECLNSVPLHEEEAVAFVDSIEPFLDWQSDAKYKADPPKDYFYPSYDLFANLAEVRSNIKGGKYKNEYEFQADLYVSVFGMGHDGHFVVYPDLLARAFSWERQDSLVSISEDGKSLPVIKVYDDVVSSPETAKVVKLINGVDAAKYIEDTISTATLNQDIDSAYNSMFYEKSIYANRGTTGYFAGGGRIRFIYQGANTTVTFDDDTSVTSENKAAVIGDMSGVIDGPSFYNKFCTPRVPDSSGSSPKGGDGQVPGYPKPVISTKDGVVSGYYLEGEGLDDVAVIALLSFISDSPAEFQAVARDFYAEAIAAGKTKLVIDFQGNGGGYVLQGYDFFRQLFPDILEDGVSRWKGNDAYIAIARAFSDEVANLDPYTSNDDKKIEMYNTWFSYRYDLNLTDDNFLTFADKFAPHIFKDTSYTALMRWNLTDTLITTNDTYGMGIEISGYGSLQNLSQPFAAENIVMLYDGVCASTCTLASEMLRIQGKVKSVAIGGRPIEGPIQGVGGVKGAQVLSFKGILNYVKRAMAVAKDSKTIAAFSRYSSLAMERSVAAVVNVRDQILRDNVNDGLPAQFVVENSDCRLYWTAPMISDVSEVWKAAAKSAFNGAKCAHGGIASTFGKRAHVAPRQSVPRARDSDRVFRPVPPAARSEEWLAMYQQKIVE